MTGWHLFCLAHFDELRVLGAKCHTVSCLEPAAATVHWVSGPLRCCDGCTAKWRQVAHALGMSLHVERRPDYTPSGLDDAEQRFALLELT